jgi:ATP-binding protein involved in chromosome partitioning
MECDAEENLSPVASDHARHPRNNGPLVNFTGHARITGPCGDTMEFWLLVRDRTIVKASFVTDGCGPSRACGSMATCLVEGKIVEQAAAITQQDILNTLGDLPEEHRHCALLAANTLRAAYEDSMKNTADEPAESYSNRIKHKILVLSGKGGVGKSSIAVNLAVWLAKRGNQVGLLDVDIHGPSVPKLLHLEGTRLQAVDGKIEPLAYGNRLKVMSIGLMLNDPTDAVIWRGPMKHNVIQQFVEGVAWGDLDYLVVDCPPGTGDEALSAVQVLGSVDGALVVTTPQDLAVVDVQKCLTFCRQLNLPVLGVIENMSGFVCPHCGHRTDVFAGFGGQKMAEDFGVPFLGSIPLDPALGRACDAGRPFIDFDKDSPTAQALVHAFEPLVKSQENLTDRKEQHDMKIAIPLAGGRLSTHFGHCEQFAIVNVDPQDNVIRDQAVLNPPPHEPGVLPAWLAQQGVTVVIAGGMGQRAQGLFTDHGIQVIVGAPAETPEKLVADYLARTLQVGENTCDH